MIGFVPTTDLDRALLFYRDVLGLEFVDNDGFALLFRSGDRAIRIVDVGELTPHPFTILGWEMPGIDAEVERLAAAGIEFLRFGHFDQDDLGIWTAPSGDRVAWFSDPDGNVLSLSATLEV
jgi:catechol 2,3-dioxygenase-like lactoylglutathione lyase family enzyme